MVSKSASLLLHPHASFKLVLVLQKAMALRPWFIKPFNCTRHCALVPLCHRREGRPHHTLCHYDHELHTTTCCGAHVWVLPRLAHVSCSRLGPCAEAPRYVHTHATFPSLKSPTPTPLKSILSQFRSL